MAVRDAGFKPIQYAGTSGGSIIAMLAACGMDLDDMHTLTMTTDWSDMLTFSPWSLIANKGYCSGDTLLNWMIDKSDGKTFAELDTDLVIMASDITNAAPFEFSRRTTPNVKVAFAARASASIPVAYAPVEYNGCLLEDGGVENNIPADKLILDSVPRLGIQLVSKSAPLTPGGHSFLSTLPRLVNMLLDANENTHVDLEEQEGTHFAFVETGFANGLDRNTSSASVMMQLSQQRIRKRTTCVGKSRYRIGTRSQNMTTIQIDFWDLVRMGGAVVAFLIGAFWVLIVMMVRQFKADLKRRFEELEKARKEANEHADDRLDKLSAQQVEANTRATERLDQLEVLQRATDKDILMLRAELPDKYVRTRRRHPLGDGITRQARWFGDAHGSLFWEEYQCLT